MATDGTNWHPRDLRDERLAAALAAGATYTLGDLLSPAEPAPTRHAAARTILDSGAKLREQAELVERIDALEARRPDARLRSVA